MVDESWGPVFAILESVAWYAYMDARNDVGTGGGVFKEFQIMYYWECYGPDPVHLYAMSLQPNAGYFIFQARLSAFTAKVDCRRLVIVRVARLPKVSQ